MPSGGCYIVRADRNTVVARQYFISTSLRLPKTPSEQKCALKMNHIKTHFSCKQTIFLVNTILWLLYSKVIPFNHYTILLLSPRESCLSCVSYFEVRLQLRLISSGSILPSVCILFHLKKNKIKKPFIFHVA